MRTLLNYFWHTTPARRTVRITLCLPFSPLILLFFAIGCVGACLLPEGDGRW